METIAEEKSAWIPAIHVTGNSFSEFSDVKSLLYCT